MTEKLCGNCPYNPVEQMIRGGDEPCPDAFKEQAKYCNYNYNCQKHSRRLIDAEALIAALLEARREETETTLKLIRFIRKQPTIAIDDDLISREALEDDLIDNAGWDFTSRIGMIISRQPTVELTAERERRLHETTHNDI